jgi:quercetin dioxygenase-like cupin family protein
MHKPTFYESLMQRQADSAVYKGKLILKAKEVEWHVSPQGRNAAIVDSTTGLEAKCFGIVLSEIVPGGQSGLHKHTFEAVGYVLEGRGYEIVGDERLEWEAGDTFYLPANVPHRHVNLDKEKPARVLLIESWPLAIYLGISSLEQLEGARVDKPHS